MVTAPIKWSEILNAIQIVLGRQGIEVTPDRILSKDSTRVWLGTFIRPQWAFEIYPTILNILFCAGKLDMLRELVILLRESNNTTKRDERTKILTQGDSLLRRNSAATDYKNVCIGLNYRPFNMRAGRITQKQIRKQLRKQNQKEIRKAMRNKGKTVKRAKSEQTASR